MRKSGRIDLNGLMLFYETVNARSINKASQLLDIPKSTISRRLRLLEAQFNSTLLKRGSHSLGLTESGQALYRRCELIADELEKVNLQTSQIQDELTGVLRVSMPSFFVEWVSEAIAGFAQLHPMLCLEIEAHNRQVNVADEPFDVAIHFGKPAETFHPTRRLIELPRSFYATPDYVTRHGLPSGYIDLSSHHLIVHQFQMRDRIFPWLTQQGEGATPIVPRALANNAIMIRDFVLRGLGIGLMPDVMCRDAVNAGSLVKIELDWQSPPLMTSATYIAREYAPRKIRTFLDFLAARLQELVESPSAG
ncbi:LysR family transcriptional regulator [Neorhizobium sp. DT-125]|uniref:LysR family transcriptional regulator n=1 Tax=Neorhizobium sp. DT-125 TaxID=3396163 RepID=UPI003F1B07B6